MALYSQVEIVNMSISQAYLAKSIISSDMKSITLNISIINFEIKKLNFFKVLNYFVLNNNYNKTFRLLIGGVYIRTSIISKKYKEIYKYLIADMNFF